MKKLLITLLCLMATKLLPNNAPQIAGIITAHAVAKNNSFTFEQWKAACLALKDNQDSPSPLTYTHFKVTLGQFIKTDMQLYECQKSWLNGKKPSNSADFVPFVQKLIIPESSKVALIGDLHGNVHAIIRILDSMKKEGILDNNFKIIHPNYHVLFLGDYVDRGAHGVEVLYTIMRLKLANPDNVWMVRGNHEDQLLNQHYGFSEELAEKFKLTDTQELAHIYSIYNLMPTALFLGAGKTESADFVLCCHGGWELGYNPKNLLDADKTVQYELIETISRKEAIRCLPTTLKKEVITVLPETEMVDVVPKQPTQPTALGFMWTDFIVDNDAKSLDFNAARGWIYGKLFTKYLLEKQSSDSHKLCAIFRAHQHHGPMLEKLIQQKGLVSLWNGLVYTILSAPVARTHFPYTAYTTVTTAHNFDNWVITPHVI